MAIKPKILFLIPSLACGGTEKVISTLINHWDGEKFDILLGVNSKEIPFYPITNTAVSITIFGKSRVRYTWIMLLKLIWKERPDYIFSVLDFTRLMILLKPFIPTSCKLIARESNYLFEWLNTSQKILSQYLYSNIDLLVVQSALMEQHIIQYLPEIAPRTLVIPNPIDTALVRSWLRSHWNITFLIAHFYNYCKTRCHQRASANFGSIDFARYTILLLYRR
jgi:glycosyltransferase involved in cell wall biosynthesis